VEELTEDPDVQQAVEEEFEGVVAQWLRRARR
jgi:hypothetical protein